MNLSARVTQGICVIQLRHTLFKTHSLCFDKLSFIRSEEALSPESPLSSIPLCWINPPQPRWSESSVQWVIGKSNDRLASNTESDNRCCITTPEFKIKHNQYVEWSSLEVNSPTLTSISLASRQNNCFTIVWEMPQGWIINYRSSRTTSVEPRKVITCFERLPTTNNLSMQEAELKLCLISCNINVCCPCEVNKPINKMNV